MSEDKAAIDVVRKDAIQLVHPEGGEVENPRGFGHLRDRLAGVSPGTKGRPSWYTDKLRTAALSRCLTGLRPGLALQACGVEPGLVRKLFLQAEKGHTLAKFIQDELTTANAMFLAELYNVSRETLMRAGPASERVRQDMQEKLERGLTLEDEEFEDLTIMVRSIKGVAK